MGPDDEFGWTFREEYPAVVRTVYLMLGDRSAAEDAAQEAFVRMYARWRRIRRYDRPGAWVRRVAIRLASRSRARAGRVASLADADRPADQRLPDPDLRRA